MNIQKGDIIRSIAGRDKGNLLFVLDISEENVYLVDGIIRHINNPKKKKIKHTMFHKRDENSAVRTKIINCYELNDAQIRKEIRIQDNSIGGYATCQKTTL